MAEHAAHEMARRGFPVRPSRVQALSGFLDEWGPHWAIPPEPSLPLLHILIAEALEEVKPPRFLPIIESSGLHAALAELFERIPPQTRLPSGIAEIFQYVREHLDRRSFALRAGRLRAAAAQLRQSATRVPARVIFNGFYTLSPAEKEFVEALASRTAVTIRDPDVASMEAPRVCFSAATPEREAEEIGRRILEYCARSRSFRDIAIVLRSRDPYAGILETALARFGIPVRARFADPLASHPAIAFLCRIVQASLSGWDHAVLLEALRTPVSGVGATPAGDRFDFALRELLPGKGLGSLQGIPDAPALLSDLAALDRWRGERHLPQIWAERLMSLSRLLPQPSVPDSPADRDQIRVWRSTAAAVRAFEEKLREVAAFLPAREMPIEQFWPRVETMLTLEPLPVEDRRCNVVSIMDVFEARRWNPPIVFVCGLLERLFPIYHREDPLLGDALRARMGLSTAAQRQQEERFLFQLAVTRATEQTVLSYPRFGEKGEETIPSFFLDRSVPAAVQNAYPMSIVATELRPSESGIRHPALLTKLAKTHRKLSPTGIESFLQCPFQFFARRTLRLLARPPAPRDRLTILEQARIMHRALAEWIQLPLLGAQILNRVFEEECARLRIPPTYRTEAVRLELLRNFEALLHDRRLRLGWSSRGELDFKFTLTPELTIQGRIDRVDVSPSGEALVIDYKYSAGNKVRERVEESEGGNLVQAGLYMLAAERAMNLKPIGMLYCGMKKETSWGGWRLHVAGLEGVGEERTREGLRELMEQAAQRAAEVHERVISGDIGVRPADVKKCAWCDYRDACRVENMAAETVLAGVTQPA